jgi:SAM-dependent methyltransferase
MSATDKVFSGSIATIYESHMVPLLFAPYAVEMAARVAAHAPTAVLEVAAGTGAVTAELLRQLPRETTITATDLNQGMLDVAAAKLSDRRLRLRSCDALDLPFEDQTFDAVVCQFGVMFFPDKLTAYREARRVLRKGGTYFLSVWDTLDSSPFFDVVTAAMAQAFPQDPPAFFRRTPYGYNDVAAITATLAEAGFGGITSDKVTFPSTAPSAAHVAMALCQGTPLRSEIEQRAPDGLAEATEVAERAIEQAFGKGPVETTMRAILFEAAA